MNESDLKVIPAWSVLACLGVSSRFRLVMALAAGERCVGELADAVGLSQSCTTRHLQALERAGLVKGHREGRRVRFRLRSEAPWLAELLGWALTGTGREAVDADGASISARAYDPAPPPVGGRVEPSEVGTSLRGGVGRAPSEGPSAGARMPHRGDRDAHASGSSGPARKPPDLEDYLL